MTKERWTVEMELDVNSDGKAEFEAEEGYYRDIDERGIIHWRYGVDNVMLPWKLIKRESLE